MSVSTKPRRKYRPKPVSSNPVLLAMRRASKIPAAEIAEVLAPVNEGFKALREGVASEDQWCVLAGAVELALSIERKGVIRGLLGHLKAAEAALAAISARSLSTGAWKPTALYFQEIGALDEFTWIHCEQLKALSEGEWRQAHAHAMAQVLSDGGRAIDICDVLAGQEQLQLLGTIP